MNTIIISTPLIMAAIALLLLAIVATMVNPFSRGLRLGFLSFKPDSEAADAPEAAETAAESAQEAGNDRLPPLSVIITVHDEAARLERHLPAILGQQYPDFKVIVVGEGKKDEAADVVTRLQSRFNNLYYTAIPTTSRYMSRKKLQMTLGMKAAHTDWVVLVEATCEPESPLWLRRMGEQMGNGADCVVSLATLDSATAARRRFVFDRETLYALRRIDRRRAFASAAPGVAIRKNDFLSHGTFGDSLRFARGEYELLTNTYGRPGTTAVAAQPDARLIIDEPTDREWISMWLFHHSVKGALSGMTGHRLLRLADSLLPHLSLVSSLTAIVTGAIAQWWLLVGAAVVALLVLVVGRMALAHAALRRLGGHFSPLSLPLMEWSLWQHRLAMWWRYQRADKTDFTSHKL